MSGVGVCQNFNITTRRNLNIHILTQYLWLLHGGIISVHILILSFSKVCPAYNPVVMYEHLLGPPLSQLHTFKSGNWVRTGWMNKLWVSFPLWLVYALGQQGLVSPTHDSSGAVPVIRGHRTPRGSSGTLDKDLICKGHLLEGWKRNTEVFDGIFATPRVCNFKLQGRLLESWGPASRKECLHSKNAH